MPARRSACALPDAIAAGSSVGCLPRSVARVLLSRGAAGGETRALAALVMPPRWCASLLARIRVCVCVFFLEMSLFPSIMFLKKNQSTPRPSEHPPVMGGKISKRLGGIKGCKYKTSSWHLNRFPDADNIGSTV